MVTTIPRSAALTRPQARRPYEPFGACRSAWRSARREVLLAGPADTGKSRLWLEKLHSCADRWPGARIQVVRKTRKSITQSAAVTYEQKVLPEGALTARRKPGHIYFNVSDQQYEYPNGSIIALTGMDDPEKAKSSEYDMIYVQEATELREHDWEMLTRALRNGVMPFQQLCADCNPSFAHHWLKKRCERGDTLMLVSRHTDNPSVTPERLALLQSLTGVRYLRLYKGIWASAEGMVYTEWDETVHVLSHQQLLDRHILWPDGTLNRQTIRHLIAGLDWGYQNPGVIHVYGRDGDDRLYLLREIYRTQRTIDWWIQQAQALAREFDHPAGSIEEWVADPARPDYIAQFNQAGLPTVGAENAIAPGIDLVKRRLRVAGDGLPRLFLYAHATPERDELLEADEQHLHKPTDITGEIEQYAWAEAKDGKPLKEEPIDDANHSLDVLRYVVTHLDGGGANDEDDRRAAQALASYRGY